MSRNGLSIRFQNGQVKGKFRTDAGPLEYLRNRSTVSPGSDKIVMGIRLITNTTFIKERGQSEPLWSKQLKYQVPSGAVVRKSREIDLSLLGLLLGGRTNYTHHLPPMGPSFRRLIFSVIGTLLIGHRSQPVGPKPRGGSFKAVSKRNLQATRLDPRIREHAHLNFQLLAWLVPNRTTCPHWTTRRTGNVNRRRSP